MKIKPIISILFLFSFSFYNLCPALMQGDCGFSVLDSTSIGKIPSCPSCSNHCNTETENTPQQEKPQIGNCCFVGLELTVPNESNDLDLSKLFHTTLSLIVVLSSPSAFSPSYETALRPRPFLNFYAYFPICQASPRAPPHSPPQFSHI